MTKFREEMGQRWIKSKRKKHPMAKKTRDRELGLDRKWRKMKAICYSFYERRCMKCGYVGHELHVDHIKPKSKYPELKYDIKNLQILCKLCNVKKSNTDETDYRTDDDIASMLDYLDKSNQEYLLY